MSKAFETRSASQPTLADVVRRWAWIGILGGSSIGFSLLFACATPFVALVTLAALSMTRRDALIVTGAVWLANQAVGYGILDYPRTFDSYAWGVAIGVAALLALFAARTIGEQVERRGPFVATGAAFGVAFAIYELTLYISAFWLPSSGFRRVVVGCRLHPAGQCAWLGRPDHPQACGGDCRAGDDQGVGIALVSARQSQPRSESPAPAGVPRHELRRACRSDPGGPPASNAAACAAGHAH